MAWITTTTLLTACCLMMTLAPLPSEGRTATTRLLTDRASQVVSQQRVQHARTPHSATAVTVSMNMVDGRCVEVHDMTNDKGTDDDDAAATGSYLNTVSTTGWGVLRINTSSDSSASDQAFAAGCVEAKLTVNETYNYWINYMKEEYGGTTPPPAVVAFLDHQRTWLRAQMLKPENQGDVYWKAMSLVMAQWDGFAQGIQQYATPAQRSILTPSSLYLLCSVGDLETINGLVRHDPLPVPSLATEDALPCSSLISLQTGPCHNDVSSHAAQLHADITKSTTDNIHTHSNTTNTTNHGHQKCVTDIFASQATWRAYYAMLRIYKVYTFAYYPAKAITIASSPGLLHSKDDFLSSPQLWVAETTNMVSNASMRQWNLDHSNTTALSWQRTMVATGWADSGREWVDLFARENSGTYNNQWMVLDASKVTVGQPLPDTDVLWIAEQVPGLVASMDVTPVLMAKGYWPSYNIAYIRDIYAWSGYPANRSSPYGYDGAPRARIFQRDAPNVNTWEGFKRLIRYNDFEHDSICAVHDVDGHTNTPLAESELNRNDNHHDPALGRPMGDAVVHTQQTGPSGTCAISARADLPGPHGAPFGGIDAKVIKLTSMQAVLGTNQAPQVEAQCGPTHDQQPPFSWKAFPNTSHVGLPEVFNFDWVVM
eukprot:m.21411 g.21411  ORF g.21411 m.21411 type:complete len:654 (+) comp3892_c0_seq1:269-2230(+)